MTPKTILINRISIRGKLVDLTNPIKFTIIPDIRKQNYYVAYNPLNLYAVHNEQDVAIDLVKMQISTLYIKYVYEDIENLTQDARELRKKLINIVYGEVEE